MPTLTRRNLLRDLGIAAGVAALPGVSEARKQPGFSFVHLTDMHIQPELGAISLAVPTPN